MDIHQPIVNTVGDLVVSLIGIIDIHVITVSNRYVEKVAQNRVDRFITACEKKFDKKYKDFNVFEKETIYQKWKPAADDLLEKFYIEI